MEDGADPAFVIGVRSLFYEVPVKSILIATRVFAFLTLLFVPSFLVMIGVGLILGEAFWFGTAAFATLTVNFVLVLIKPVRDWVWRWACGIAGVPSRLPPARPWPGLEQPRPEPAPPPG